MRRVSILSAVFAGCILLCCPSAFAQPFTDVPSPDNPAVATYNGGAVTLRNLEDYASEIDKLDRCPRLVDGGIWRRHLAGELGKSILFTSHALSLGEHLEPSFLRARNYYIQEWSSYAMLRDNVVNKIDVNRNTLQDYYELHKTDWYVSATVSLRMIRTRDEDKAETAMERIRKGDAFEEVEKDFSQMSLKMRGQIHGPFPTTDTLVMRIPPPNEVIEVARLMEPGETTGPLSLNGNYFIVQTAAKSPDKQLTFEEAVPFVETQVRNLQGDLLIKKLLAQLSDELNVQRNDTALNDPATKVDDVIATVGDSLVPYDEYYALAGKVRGPALHASTMESTPLARFIVPTIFTEAAKRRGYLEDAEFKKSLLFHDIRRIGRRMMNRMVDEMTPRVTEAEIRRYYNTNKNSKDSHGHILGDMKLEDMRGEIMELLNQQKRGQIEERIQTQILGENEFKMVEAPVTTELTAFEALIAAADRLPSGARIQMIASVPEGETTGPTKLVNCGRRAQWKIVCTSEAEPDKAHELIAPTPAPMYNASTSFTSHPLHLQLQPFWRFDSDALARLGYDSGMTDYMAKHNRNVHINTRVEFDWDADALKECWIVFEMRPLESGLEDEVLTLRYSAVTGSMTRKPFHECLPCEQMKRLMNDPI